MAMPSIFKSLLIGLVFASFVFCVTLSSSHDDFDKSLPIPAFQHELLHSLPNPLRHRMMMSSEEITPLYPGYGTHFSYIYVGTPAQRVSVIVDTGSHHTAFPCAGCKECGEHTDPYWNPQSSQSAYIPKCSGEKPCQLSQSYSEGSTWYAYKVHDKLWVGGIAPITVPKGHEYTVNMTFGCQSSVTGLFKQQLADGIMGMSISDDTIVSQLYIQKITTSKIFALCFRTGGGIMTIGGVDQSIHTHRVKPQYTKLQKSSGWYQVHLEDIRLQNPNTRETTSIGVESAKFNGGRGVIVDSGTTDTYLPAGISAAFGSLFRTLTGGITISNTEVKLSSQQRQTIPNIIFVFQSLEGKHFEVDLAAEDYVDDLGGGRYAFRVYLTEANGAVLGANFMNNFNIIFDSEGNRVGFAPSTCKYEDFLPTPQPSKHTKDPNCVSELIPLGPCNTSCRATDHIHKKKKKFKDYLVTGLQPWGDKCDVDRVTAKYKECSEFCRDTKITRASDTGCPIAAWSECSKNCVQTRVKYEYYSIVNGEESCVELPVEERTCYSQSCPAKPGDYILYIDMTTTFHPEEWSYLYTEDFISALDLLFHVGESNIQLLADVTAVMSPVTELQFQMRIRKSDYADSISQLYQRAQNILSAIKKEDFVKKFIDALRAGLKKTDTEMTYDRYGWLRTNDIEITNAVMLPIGDIRDPNVPKEKSNNNQNYIDISDEAISSTLKTELTLLGVAIVCIIIIVVLVYMHCRLLYLHAALGKDKSGSFREMWNRFKARRLNPLLKRKSGRGRAGSLGKKGLMMNSWVGKRGAAGDSIGLNGSNNEAELQSFISRDGSSNNPGGMDDRLDDEEFRS